MQFTTEVVWTLSDFIFMGGLIFGTGFSYLLITKNRKSWSYRIGLGLALVGPFFVLWINGAVGFIGNEGNPANLMYLGVIAIEIIGALIAWLRTQGMAYVMFATALAQALVPVFALILWPPEVISWGAAGVSGVFVLNTFFVILFATSGLFFRHAIGEQNKAHTTTK
jgi:hypothetical protein|tara:strand:+ start:506 stop:1006 length:501 start_codon:yes stop_codon:yes gene_type:complete